MRAKKADKARKSIYGNAVYVRGLIEIGNVCKNDCFYCGIRKSNGHCDRYILKEKDILHCAKQGYELGFRTFVLQGGEGVFSPDVICRTVKKLKEMFPDCAVTLSLGEYEREVLRPSFRQEPTDTFSATKQQTRSTMKSFTQRACPLSAV